MRLVTRRLSNRGKAGGQGLIVRGNTNGKGRIAVGSPKDQASYRGYTAHPKPKLALPAPPVALAARAKKNPARRMTVVSLIQ